MVNNFEKITTDYSSQFEIHGVSSASMLMPKGRHSARFEVVAKYIEQFQNPSVLDYGCGLGFLHAYLTENKIQHQYTGVDIVPDFIKSCRERFVPPAVFQQIHPEDQITDSYDFVYASGVFNLRSADDDDVSFSYVRARLLELFKITKQVMIVDFLSPDVDFRQDGAQHIDYRTVLDWLIPDNSRRWVLRHDYLPYEYSIVVFKDDEIIRPENTFRESRER